MASNIVGEGFENYVIDQIQKRQEILAKPKKSNQDLVWENSRTGWVKLVSSANLADKEYLPSSITSGDYEGGAKLAERFVLFNGVTNEIPKTNPNIENIQRAGVGLNNVWSGNNAYGLGGTQFGLNPMPGIISANIKTEARGSLRTATVNIKANNTNQFELINTLYLRLGYLMLLEWGHNCYYKNNNDFESDSNVSLADAFLTAKYTYNGFLEQIKEKRKETDSNYDALVGKVVNFNWTFNKDGSYDIVIILRSIGDVIESLKVNLLSSDRKFDIKESQTSGLGENTGFNSVDAVQGKVTSNSIIVAFASAHSIGAKFADIQYEFYVTYGGKSPSASNTNGMQFLPVEGEIKDYIVQEYKNNLTNLYVRFGAFLDILSDLVIPSVKGTNKKIISFGDTKDEANKILAYSPGGQISSDPRICTFRQVVGDYTISGAATDPFYKKNNNNYVKLMNVYFNFVFILHLLEDLKDKNGKVPLVDFLNAMWRGYCQSTGNYNNITVGIDDESNEVIFIDETALPDREDLLSNSNYATFNVYGFATNSSGSLIGGSFVRDLQLKTEITSDLATMITVGSTANGYITGQDATILSNINRGTTPRINSDLISPPNTSNEESTDPNSPIEVRYADTLNSYNRFIAEIGSYQNSSIPNWNEDAYTQFTNTQTQLLEYQQQFNTNIARLAGKYASSPNDGFLPFNLSLTMDGLSGMKVYQRYTINSTFLPKAYHKSVDFIIKRVDHNIQNNTWTTNIESIAIPKLPVSSSTIKLFESSPKSSAYAGSAYNVQVPPNTPVEHINIDNVGKLRNLIVETAKKYNGVTEVGNTTGFRPNSVDFENKIRSVGWTGYNGAHWCNWFANLVWKEAYNEYAKTDPLIKPTISNIFNDFKLKQSITPPLTSNAIQTFNSMSNVKGNNYSIRFQKEKSVPKPGDIIVYSSSHVAICGKVDAKNRRYERIDGNWGVEGQGRIIVTSTGVYTYLDGTGDGIEILGFITPPYADTDDIPYYLQKPVTTNTPTSPFDVRNAFQ